MPWVLLRTRNKNTGSRVNPTARPCGARPKVANDQVLRVKDPQNMFRGLWTSLGAPKIVQKQLELSLKLSLELSLKLSLELSLKTQLKTRLQTRVTPLIKENHARCQKRLQVTRLGLRHPYLGYPLEVFKSSSESLFCLLLSYNVEYYSVCI